MSLDLSRQYMHAVMPWTTNDPVKLEQALIGLTLQADYINRRWAQRWFENFQFVLGNHYLRWSRQFDYAVDIDFLRGGMDTQKRSQTNISRTVVESLSSMIYSQLGDIFAEAKYDSTSRGARLAKLLESLSTCYDERLGMHEKFDIASVMFVMFDKVYAAIDFHQAKGASFQRPRQELRKVPRMTTRLEPDPVTGELMTVPVPVLGADGNPVMVDAFEDVIGPDGRPVMEWVKTGDLDVTMHSPFEVAYDAMAKTFSESKWTQRYMVMDYDDFMTKYGDQEGVIEEEIDRVRGGHISHPIKNVAMRHFMRTMFAMPPLLDAGGQLNMTSMHTLRHKVFVVEHHDRPSEGHRKNRTPWLSEGRRCIVANGRLVLVSTPQYRMSHDTGWHNLAECKWLPLAPSNQSSGPMSDTVQKNREINLTDSLTTLAIQRLSGGAVIINENSGIDKNKWTGEPGMTYYSSTDPSSAVSIVGERQPLPPVVTQRRETLKEDIYEVSGTGDALRGGRSPGASSGYQARLYEEREKRRSSKASNNWESFAAMIYMKRAACLQQNAVKLDQSVIARIMRSSDGDVTESDVLAFLNGPIDFGVDLFIRPDSMRTKSKATQIADIQESLAIPAIAERLVQDPAVVDSYLDFLGIDVLRDINSVHRDRAKKENCIFNDMIPYKDPAQLMAAFGHDLPTVIWQDNDLVHMVEHARDFVKNFDKYRRNPAAMSAFTYHQAWHEQNYKAKGGQQTPYLAQTATEMAQRAEASAAQPKNLIDELKRLAEMKRAAVGAEAAPGPESSGKPAAAAAAEGADNSKGEG